MTQTTQLVEGWNWFSTYIEADAPVALLQMLETSLDDNALQISSANDGTTEYDDGEWLGELDEIGISNEQMYLILAGNDCTIELQGIPANPAEHVVTINPGWNWIGFPCNDEIEINVALANFDAEIGDMIASQFDGITEYDDEWIGDFETFVPGQGYLYFSNSDQTKTLIFQKVRSKE